MRLTILGCVGSGPGPGQAASGYLLEADGFRLGIEFGNGVFARLIEETGDAFALDALALTHLHPDHCADFSALAVFRMVHPHPPVNTREKKLPVFAPSDAPQRLLNAFAANDEELSRINLGKFFEFHAWSSSDVTIGPFTVTPVLMNHPVTTFGLRIHYGDSVLAYTGDTGPCAALDVLAAKADMLLSEACWTDAPDRPAGLHLSGKQAGELARRTQVKRLMLTHIPMWIDKPAVLAEAQKEFSNTELVHQGAVYEF